MSIEPRRIFDFIMGIVVGFLFFYADWLSIAVGCLLFITFIITLYRPRMLKFLDDSIEKDKQECEK